MDAGQTLSLVATLGPGLEWGAFCPSSEQYDAYGTTSIYSDLSIRFIGPQNGPATTQVGG